MRNFTYREFDSPDLPGSGDKMDREFLEKLDLAREMADIPFNISKGGGYRTRVYHLEIYRKLKKRPTNSAHLRGLAADIAVPDSGARYKIVNALIRAGFHRIGVGKNFIHVDDDHTLPREVIWTY